MKRNDRRRGNNNNKKLNGKRKAEEYREKGR